MLVVVILVVVVVDIKVNVKLIHNCSSSSTICNNRLVEKKDFFF